MTTGAQVAERLGALRARCAGAGAPDIRIVAVTKGQSADAVRVTAEVGLDAIGESYAQELLAKRSELADTFPGPWPEVHFIGRIQRNKVRRLAGIVDVWQSVDRAEIVDELGRRAPGASIMVQVDISGETSKGGCPQQDAPGLVDRARDAGLDVVGLMGIGPRGPAEGAREGFRRLRALVDEVGVRECSMGMSADIEIAIEEGSTMLRVGTGLFGPRPPRVRGDAGQASDR